MSKKVITKPVLSLSKIQVHHEHDPLKLFYSGIKSEETKLVYAKTLREFQNPKMRFFRVNYVPIMVLAIINIATATKRIENILESLSLGAFIESFVPANPPTVPPIMNRIETNH